ncbi:hypothetical protein D3C76_1088580 [compost metagenome]
MFAACSWAEVCRRSRALWSSICVLALLTRAALRLDCISVAAISTTTMASRHRPASKVIFH